MTLSPCDAITQTMLNNLLPPERTDEFFEALYGDVEEGAYDIRLVLRNAEPACVSLAFELQQRQNKCLVCSLTYGLPQVFQRHPLINAANIAKEVAKAMDWEAEKVTWTLGRTEENSPELHSIPLTIYPG